jgi:hypothetical protein
MNDEYRSNPALREQVLKQTLGIVRRRRRLGRLRWAGALAACYLAGMLTTRWLGAADEAHNGDLAIAVASPVSIPLVGKAAPSQASMPYETLRERGDRELKNPRTIPSAIRRYSRALAEASHDQRAIDPDRDTWLLMALKLDQSTENKHAGDTN